MSYLFNARAKAALSGLVVRAKGSVGKAISAPFSFRSGGRRWIQLVSVVLLSLGSLTSCGGSNLGAGLAIAVTPTRAFVVPGNGSSCVDLAAQIGSVAGTVPSESVTGPRILFSNFRLQWTRSDSLSVDVIVITMNGGGMNNFQVILDSDEIAALIGKAGGLIPSGHSTSNPFNVDSDSSAEKDSGYIGCPLTFSIQPPTNSDGTTISPTGNFFSVSMIIEVLGTAQDPASGNVSPVKQTIYAQAQNLF